MRTLSSFLALLAVSVLSGPGVHAQRAARATPATYDARAFFTTTSYALSGGLAWSSDDRELLVTSDETGIFNAYAMSAGLDLVLPEIEPSARADYELAGRNVYPSPITGNITGIGAQLMTGVTIQHASTSDGQALRSFNSNTAT